MSVAARNRVAVALAVLAFVAAVVASPNFRVEDGPHAEAFAGDFVHEWVGAWMVAHGDRARFYDPGYARAVQHDPAAMGFTWDAGQWLPVVYPPFWYVVVEPLRLLPFRVAALVFVGMMAACFAATVALLLRAAPARRPLLPWMLVASAAFAPLWASLLSAQKGTLLLLLFTATWLLLARGRSAAAGAVFGLVAFKPQLLPVVAGAMLLRGDRRFVAGLAAALAVLAAVSLGVGVDVCRQYLAVAATAGRYVDTPGFPLAQMHCWYGFFRLLLPGAPLAVVQAATALAIAATLAAVAALLRGTPGPAPDALGFAGLVVATILASFHLLQYDLTLLLLPAWLVATRLVDRDPTVERHRLALAALLGALVGAAGLSAAVVGATRVQPTVPLLFALLVVLARVPRAAPAVNPAAAWAMQRGR